MTDNERNTEDRLRDALSAYEQVEPAGDAWGKIRAGVNAKQTKRRTVFWSSLGLAGAAAAVVAVIGFAAVRSGDDGERVVSNPPTIPRVSSRSRTRASSAATTRPVATRASSRKPVGRSVPTSRRPPSLWRKTGPSFSVAG
ncbi:MAG: hypothetical protein M5U31_04830 [Acidimicrobiia bacterium]|nr:hypothetical protein [Acidimicrobiia bacterium]